MRHTSGITGVEVLILLAIIVLLVAILLPAMGTRHRCGRQMQNSTQVRGIHSGLVLFAQGNNMHYPGVTANGKNIAPDIGLSVEGRIQKLIDESYFTREYAISPHEQYTGITSYALLQVNADVTDETGQRVAQGGRNDEWKDTSNTLAVVISDRAVNNGKNFGEIKSIHTKPAMGKTDWKGSVGWNDNHVTFESTFIQPTKYGDVDHEQDHLFTNQTGDAHTGSDAFMVHSGASNL